MSSFSLLLYCLFSDQRLTKGPYRLKITLFYPLPYPSSISSLPPQSSTSSDSEVSHEEQNDVFSDSVVLEPSLETSYDGDP